MTSSWFYEVTTDEGSYTTSSTFDPFGNALPGQGGTVTGQTGRDFAYSGQGVLAIDAVFINIFGAYPSSNDAQGAAAYIASGAGIGQLTLAIEYGAEVAHDIANIYQQTLGRADTASDLKYWQSTFASHNMLDIRIAGANSAEAATAITSIYEAVLGRANTAYELAQQQYYLIHGGSLAAMRTTLAHSQEATNVIDASYLAILNRAANPADITNFQALLANGGSQKAVTTAIAVSQEAANVVGIIYQTILGRADGPTDLANWQTVFENGGSQSTVRAGLALSQEATNDIGGIFQAILGRADTSVDLTNCESIFENGGSQGTIRSDLALGQEATNDIDGIYSAILRRAPSQSELGASQYLFENGGNQGEIRTELAASQEAVNDINALFISVAGRTPTTQELSLNQYNLATGQSLAQETSALATSSEIASDLTSALLAIDGFAPTQAVVTSYQQDLVAGSNIYGVGSLIVNSSTFQGVLSSDYQAMTGNFPSQTLLSTETATLVRDINATANINWQTIQSSLGNGFLEFISELDSVGLSIARAAGDVGGRFYTGYGVFNAIAGDPYGVPPANGSLPTVAIFNAAAANGTALDLLEKALQVGPIYEPFGTFSPQKTGYHEYRVVGTQAFATSAQAFSDLLKYPAGHLLGLSYFNSPGSVVSGQISQVYIGHIETYVDSIHQIIYNVTLQDHTLNPGIVDRSVELEGDGSYHIITLGEGNGNFPGLNDALSGFIFGGTSHTIY